MPQYSQEKTVTVPAELFAVIKDYVSIQTLATTFGIQENNLLELIKKQLVTAIPLGVSWLISIKSLETYIELHKQEVDLDRFQETLDQRKKALEQQQGQLTYAEIGMHCLTEMNDLAAWWLNQISYTIPDLRRRQIFLDVCSGKKGADLAQKYSITLGHLQFLYNQTFTTLRRKAKFLLNYRKTMYDLYCRIRRLEIRNRTYENEINRLYAEILEREKNEKPPTDLSENAIKILSTSLESLGFKNISIRTLKIHRINTIEDLLRLIKKEGFRAITSYRNVGEKAVTDLKKRLREMKVIDENEQSDLFRHL